MKPDQPNYKASILDRLIDNEPGLSHEPVQERSLSLWHIKAEIARDLENLLNTKRQIVSLPSAYRQVNNSIFMYGLRDYTAMNPGSIPVKQQLRQDIERAIAQFEPRLRNVTVQLEMSNQKERNLRFRITALLVVEPMAEPVTFDTYFDVSRSEYRISR